MTAGTRAERRAIKKAAKEERRRGEMTLVEHLQELRLRVLLCMGGVAVGAVAGWFLFEPILRILVEPYQRAVDDPDARLVLLGVGDAFSIKLRTSLLIGLALALPWILFQIWRFVTPGLHAHERRYAIPFIASAVVLFVMGVTFAYMTFPLALRVLLGFAGPETVALLTAERYLNFIFVMILAFGISFELPVLLQFLVIANVLNSRQLASFRRVAILVITIFAALITPNDPLSMVLMGLPLVVFYEAVIWISRLILKK